MSKFSKKTGSTAGRIIYRNWKLKFDIQFLSDLISGDYMRRWQLRIPQGAIRLHHIMRGDSDRDFHDHPMDFTSLILSGGYIEHTPDREPRRFLPGDINKKNAEDLHRLELVGEDAWTIVLAGPFRRDWGFMTDDGWVAAGEYDAYKVKKYGVNTLGEAPSEPKRNPLRSLSDHELLEYDTASPEEIAHALRLGELEARMMFPSSGENIDTLRREHEQLVSSVPMKGVVR